MEKSNTTLNHFFATKEFVENRLDKVAKNEKFKSLKKNASKVLKGVRLPTSFYVLMIRQIGDLLNIDIQNILARGWSQYREFLQYRDQEKYPPGKPVHVPLVEHTVISEHSPSFKPVFNNMVLGEIQFDINLEFDLKGAILKIQDGKIMSATIGSCQGKGNVEYDGFSILEVESQRLALPGSLEFGDGIPIVDPGEGTSDVLDEVVKTDDEKK